MRIISYIFVIILMFLGISFALLNAKPVDLNYYIGAIHISLSLLLVLTVGVGILIGFIFSLKYILKLKRKNYQLSYRIKQLEQSQARINTPQVVSPTTES